MNEIYKRAVELAKTNHYRSKEYIIDGVKYEFFTYNVPSYTRFKEDNSFFIRGLCFIDGVMSPGMHKFFNFGEHAEWSDLDLNHPEVKVAEKSDGSLLIPYILNGEVRFRTKNGLAPEFINLARDTMSEEQEEIIKEMLNRNQYPMFELVSPFLPIVVKYDKTELRYLGYYEFDGTIDSLHRFNMVYDNTILETDIFEYLKTATNFEGFVIQNGYKTFKIKADEYVDLHRLKDGDTLATKARILELTVNEEIDDKVAKLPDGEYKDFINSIRDKVTEHYNALKGFCEGVLSSDDMTLDRKSFALKYKDLEGFGYLINTYAGKEIEFNTWYISWFSKDYNLEKLLK